MNWNDIFAILTTGWAGGVIIFILWLFLAFFLKRKTLKRLQVYTQKTKMKIDDIILEVLNLPLNLLIVFIGLSFMQKIMPLEGEFNAYLNYTTKIVLIMAVMFLLDQIIKVLLIEFSQKSAFRHLSQSAIQGVVRGIIFMLGLLIVMDSFGVNITPLVTSLGIGSLAIALALQPTLSNLFSGLSVSLDRSVEVGDLIQLENGEKGYVMDIGWRASRVRLRSDNVIVIPNTKLVDSIVTNYETPEASMKIYIRCGVHYESDLDQVEKTVMEEVRKAEQELDTVDKTFNSWFRYEQFADSSINFCIIMRSRDFKGHFILTHEMIKRIHSRFKAEGIVIPYPLTTLDIQPKHEELLREIAGKVAS